MDIFEILCEAKLEDIIDTLCEIRQRVSKEEWDEYAENLMNFLGYTDEEFEEFIEERPYEM